MYHAIKCNVDFAQNPDFYFCMAFIQIYLKDLTLDDHARKKIIELAGHRYNKEQDELTITADRYDIWE